MTAINKSLKSTTIQRPELTYLDDNIYTDFNNLESGKICSDLYPAITPKYTCKTNLECKHADLKADKVPVIVNNESIFTMPGLGPITNDKCGMWVNALKCPNYEDINPELNLENLDKIINKREIKHDRFIVQHSCHKPTCPVCYPSWTKRVATKATERLEIGRELYMLAGFTFEYIDAHGNKKRGTLERFDHVILSPPQDEAIEAIRTLEGFKKLRKDARKKCDIMGMVGGIMIFHPFRQNDPAKITDEGGAYRYDIPPYAWYPGPHFHLVGCGYLMQSDRFYTKTGWMYKKLKPRDQITETIKYIVGYQSSHCGITKGVQSVTYFGLFSYNKIVKDRIIKIVETIKCRGCNTDLHYHEIILDDNGDMDWKNALDLGIFIRRRNKIIYKIRNSDSHEKSKQTKIDNALIHNNQRRSIKQMLDESLELNDNIPGI